MAKYKILETDNNVEFIFNSDAFKMLVKVFQKTSDSNKTIDEIRFDIAMHCNKSDETVRKWYRGHNGPNEIETVKSIADFFKVDYHVLLTENPDAKTRIVYERNKLPMYSPSAINISTIRFISLLNEFAENLSNGIIPFSKVTSDTPREMIVYDDSKGLKKGYRIVADMCLTDHHDIVSYYDTYISEEFDDPNLMMYLIVDEDEGTYIEIYTGTGDFIIIEDGSWYVV